MFGSGLRLGVGFVNPASPGWGLRWVCLGTVCGVVPLVSAVCGVRGWGSVSACLWDVCGFLRAPLAPRRFRFGRAVWACVLGRGLGCAQPFLAGLSGCVFCAVLFFFLLGVPVPGLVVPVPPSPFFRAGLLALFFFRGVCLHVSVSLFPVGRCSWLGVAGFGWVVPLCLFGGPVSGAFWGGGVWPPLVVLAGSLVAVGCFRAPPPPACKVFVQPIFSLSSVQNPDICTPTENHDPSTVLDSVGISGSGISVVLHSWCFHHFLYNKTEFGSATASPEIARADPEIVDF